jgi:HK97 family phage major capsid protein
MSEVAKRLRDRRLNLVNEMRALVDKATEENRDFTGEETGRLAAIDEEIGRLDERIKGVLDQEQRAKDADDAFDNLLGKPSTGPAGGDGQPDTGSELRKFFAGGMGRSYEVPRPKNSLEFRVLSKLTAAAGLNTVPTSFYDRLIAHLIEVSGVLQAQPTVLNTASGESLQIPKTTAHSSAAIVTEGGTIATSEPTFGQVTLSSFKYGDLMQVSRELVTDTGVDLEGYLAMQVGRALGNVLGGHLITGTGTTQPRGVVTDATSGVTFATVAGGAAVIGAPIADNLIDLMFSVIAPYRASASAYWVMRDATLAAVRKLKDTTGQYLWQPSLQLGVPDMLLGKPVVTDPFVAAIGSAAKSIIFGDFSQYFVRFVGSLRFERSDDFAFSTDLITYRCLLRADAALVDLTGAIKFGTGNTV